MKFGHTYGKYIVNKLTAKECNSLCLHCGISLEAVKVCFIQNSIQLQNNAMQAERYVSITIVHVVKKK